jgi:hypothetical protein
VSSPVPTVPLPVLPVLDSAAALDVRVVVKVSESVPPRHPRTCEADCLTWSPAPNYDAVPHHIPPCATPLRRNARQRVHVEVHGELGQSYLQRLWPWVADVNWRPRHAAPAAGAGGWGIPRALPRLARPLAVTKPNSRCRWSSRRPMHGAGCAFLSQTHSSLESMKLLVDAKKSIVGSLLPIPRKREAMEGQLSRRDPLGGVEEGVLEEQPE